MSANCKLGKLSPETTAVFLCDMQTGFQADIQYFDEVVGISSRILKAAKELDMLVIASEHEKFGPTVPQLGLKGYDGAMVYSKVQYSMVTPAILKILRSRSPSLKSIILCGVQTEVCIQSTALSLLEHGYDVHVIADACSSPTMTDRMIAFERIKASGAFLTTSTGVLYSLVGGTNHPKIKEIEHIAAVPAIDKGLSSFFGARSAII